MSEMRVPLKGLVPCVLFPSKRCHVFQNNIPLIVWWMDGWMDGWIQSINDEKSVAFVHSQSTQDGTLSDKTDYVVTRTVSVL